jgi:large subunit ribosomal protein L16
VIAIHGGYMEPRHFEMLRMKFNRYLVEGKSFAIYRVDAPYKPCTRKGAGKALGGGKGPIDHYRYLLLTAVKFLKN